MGSPAISFAKYPSVLQHHRAHEWLVMRAQFGLALNTIDAYARALSSYFDTHNLKLLEQIPVTDTERKALEGDRKALKKLIRASSSESN